MRPGKIFFLFLTFQKINIIILMRYTKLLGLLLSYFVAQHCLAQTHTCPIVTGVEGMVCGPYGDENGNNIWNWEITPSDPNYCKTWNAVTDNSGNLSRLGSPFINPVGEKLQDISYSNDYTKINGWVLLRREFGCTNDTPYPYFVLYNRFTGLIRVYVYINLSSNQFLGLTTTLSINSAQKPAFASVSNTTSNNAIYAPDKYLDNMVPSNDLLISVGTSTGQAQWSVGELPTTFDQNIRNQIYSGASFDIIVYGTTADELNLVINGQSSTSKDYAMSGKKTEGGSNVGDLAKFVATGEKVVKLLNTVDKSRKELNENADKFSKSLTELAKVDSVAKDVKAGADYVKSFTSSTSDFANLISTVYPPAAAIVNVLKLWGNITGTFGSTGAAQPTVMHYNLQGKGTITSRLVIRTITIQIPGILRMATPYLNSPYYDCPAGVFNLTKTPVLEKISYKRFTGRYEGQNQGMDYDSYRVRDDLEAHFNTSSGLEVVSVQAAVIAKLRNNPRESNHFIFQNHINGDRGTIFNHLLSDVQAGRTLLTEFDPIKYNGDTTTKNHIVQTPFVNIECFKGLAFNVPAFKVPLHNQTKVFVRVKAILKQKGGPDNKPYYFVKDYNIEVEAGANPLNTDYAAQSLSVLPPYHNYAVAATTPISDQTVNGTATISTGGNFEATRSINTQGTVVVTNPTTQYQTWWAGKYIALKPGFKAVSGSRFVATLNYGFNIGCGDPNIVRVHNYNHPDVCYRTDIAMGRISYENKAAGHPAEPLVKIYPVPTSGVIQIETKFDASQETEIALFDMMGRKVNLQKPFRKVTSSRFENNLQYLPAGVYVIRIVSGNHVINREIIMSR